jgi:tRNA pseudouridine38-40 synthase
MVRNMVGTLIDVGRGVRPPDDIAAILQARDRSRAGRTAPAHALFLEEVTYPVEFDDPVFRSSEGDSS